MSLGAIVLASGMIVPQLAAPPVAEAACGPDWTSKVVPPRTIRVLRTRSGKVQTVDFRRYVAVVMASGEWPTWWPYEALEAGAVATKQFAWYYALKGHHRPGYRTRAGRCYDVRDDTRDQLFRPERAAPTRKQQRAIDSTWGLTLRKGGRFFLTGYRLGSARRCAADADGWHLYSRSVAACARKGWSRKRIQSAYYAPRLAFVWSPAILGVSVKTPQVSLRQGTALAARPAHVHWRRSGATAEVARYKLQVRVGQRRWRNIPLAEPTATSAEVQLRPDRTHRFRVRVVDRKGRRGPWVMSGRRRVALRGPRGVTLSDGVGQAAGGPDRVARLSFTGRSIAYVAPTGPDMGSAIVKVNGKRVAVVDLERPEAGGAQLVWTKNWKRSRTRVVVVKPVSGTRRVGIDGFLVMR